MKEKPATSCEAEQEDKSEKEDKAADKKVEKVEKEAANEHIVTDTPK